MTQTPSEAPPPAPVAVLVPTGAVPDQRPLDEPNDSGRPNGDRDPEGSDGGPVSGNLVLGVMQPAAAVARLRALADDAYSNQAELGIATEILMLPTDAVYSVLGKMPPVVDTVVHEEPSVIPDGSV